MDGCPQGRVAASRQSAAIPTEEITGALPRRRYETEIPLAPTSLAHRLAA